MYFERLLSVFRPYWAIFLTGRRAVDRAYNYSCFIIFADTHSLTCSPLNAWLRCSKLPTARSTHSKRANWLNIMLMKKCQRAHVWLTAEAWGVDCCRSGRVILKYKSLAVAHQPTTPQVITKRSSNDRLWPYQPALRENLRPFRNISEQQIWQ